MVEGVVAAMDFLGVLSGKKKAELMKDGSDSVGYLQKDQAGMNVAATAEAKYNKKNDVSSDGSLRNYLQENGSFTPQLRLEGLVLDGHCHEEKALPSWIRTLNGGAKRSVEECIPRPLDLSVVGSCSKSIDLFPDLSGFGSPVAVMGGFDHKTSSDDDQDGCSRPAAATTIPGKQSGAQLTIFYGATVNVYDDIPADKAQAIMLIASSTGNHCSCPQYTKAQNGCGAQTELKTPLTLMKSSQESGIHHQSASAKMRTGVLLTRKHSLQCFIEKRKDRHPFSITSAPSDNYVSLHNRTLGDWTRELKLVFSEACEPPVGDKSGLLRADETMKKWLPKLRLDGPYGAPAQDYRKYDILLLVGLGIGATPFISILKYMLNNIKEEEEFPDSNPDFSRSTNPDYSDPVSTSTHDSSSHKPAMPTDPRKKRKPLRTTNAYFYWVTREQGSFDWFKGIMNEVAEFNLKHVIEMHNYLTSVYEEGDA